MKPVIVKVLKAIGLYGTAKNWHEHLTALISPDYKRDQIRKLNLYSKFIKKNDLAFDIGANFGDRTNIFLQLGARIIAVEPVKCCVDYMRRNFKSDKVTIINKAVGSKEEKARIKICPASALSTMSKDFLEKVAIKDNLKNLDWGKEQEIEVTTIDALKNKYGVPKFIKIDVEGYEEEVLKGLNFAPEALSCEFNLELIDIALRCINRVKELGNYEFNISQRENMFLLLEKWVSAKKIAELLKSLHKEIDYGDIYARLRKKND
jgi:FkbM family methyltransferase